MAEDPDKKFQLVDKEGIIRAYLAVNEVVHADNFSRIWPHQHGPSLKDFEAYVTQELKRPTIHFRPPIPRRLFVVWLERNTTAKAAYTVLHFAASELGVLFGQDLPPPTLQACEDWLHELQIVLESYAGLTPEHPLQKKPVTLFDNNHRCLHLDKEWPAILARVETLTPSEILNLHEECRVLDILPSGAR